MQANGKVHFQDAQANQQDVYFHLDAILGLRELFDSNWELVDSYLTALVNAIVRIIGDEVRLPFSYVPFSSLKATRMPACANNYSLF
jgi:hypothetical protein